jgi:hypothetical protein
VGFFLRVCLGFSCKSFFYFSFFNKTPYYLSKKKRLVSECCCLENGSSMHRVVFMVGKE